MEKPVAKYRSSADEILVYKNEQGFYLLLRDKNGKLSQSDIFPSIRELELDILAKDNHKGT